MCGLLTMIARVRGVMAPAIGVHVQVEGRRLELERHRDGVSGSDQQLVEEPRRRQVEHLVAGLGDRPQRDGQGTEARVRHEHVLGIPLEAGQPRERAGDRNARLGLVELVGEPVLVLRLDVPLQDVDEAGERHLLRVAHHEVGHAGRSPTRERARLDHLLHRTHRGGEAFGP